MAKKKPKSKNLKLHFCPKCNSFNVKYIWTWKNIFGFLPRLRCNDCKFQNIIFPEAVISQSHLDKLNKKAKKKKK